jgi:hypothetical protein
VPNWLAWVFTYKPWSDVSAHNQPFVKFPT